MPESRSPLTALLQRAVDVTDEEVRAVLYSCGYFFFLLAAYYIIRPLRDEMGAAGGVRNLAWLFTGTLTAMLLLHPVYAALMARVPRTKALTIVYRFFGLNLVIFFILLKISSGGANIWIGRIFFIWSAVFSLYTVSVYWSFIVDLFDTEQGKRLFGFMAAGGTIGGITGSGITALLAVPLGPVHLILISVLFLEAATRFMRGLSALSQKLRAPMPGEFGSAITEPVEVFPARKEDIAPPPVPVREEPLRGSFLAGITHVFRSPYLLGICTYMLLYPVISTFLYYQQAEIAVTYFVDRAARTAFFARIDLYVNILTLITQLFLTGRIIKSLGIGLTLALMPIFCIIGFTGLGVWQTLTVVVVFQVIRRAGNYALARPARENLYTVVSREDKYKAKNFMDTAVYRAGDQIAAWSQTLMLTFGMGMSALAFTAVPIAGVWMIVALWLGYRQKQLIQESRGSAVSE